METSTPLWLVILLAILGPLFGLLGVLAGSYMSREAERGKRALRKLEDLYVDINSRILVMQQTLESWINRPNEKASPERFDAKETFRMQFLTKMYAPKSAELLRHVVTSMQSIDPDVPGSHINGMEKAIYYMKEASLELERAGKRLS